MTNPTFPHRFEIEFEVSGTAEEVWQAIATAEGISSWMVDTEMDARPGGDLVFHMGPGSASHGKVTVVEPDRRIVYEEDWATLMGEDPTDVTPLVTEFLIESRSGGSCSVRVVTSAFGTGADWENEFFADMEVGWVPMLQNLRLYVASFPGQTATKMSLSTETSLGPDAAIDAVRERLGVTAVGDTASVCGVDCRLERSVANHIALTAVAPVEGFLTFLGFGTAIHLGGYLFGDGAASYVAAEEAQWQAWLDEIGTPVDQEPLDLKST